MDSLLEPEDSLECKYFRSPTGAWGRSFTLGVVSGFSKVLAHGLNTLRVRNHERYLDLVLHRPANVGLITVSNHTSTLDDPVVLSALTPWSHFWTDHVHQRSRWALCAKELCYRNKLLGAFFQTGKTLPVERGAGPFQAVVRALGPRLARGEWMHIFPEGRVGYTGMLLPLRWGVGKIICDAVAAGNGSAPKVLPLYHSGMGEVMPRHAWIPRVWKTVEVVVGEPLDLTDLTCRCNQKGEDQKQLWRELAARIKHGLDELEAQAPPNRPAQGFEAKAQFQREGGMPPVAAQA